MANPVYTVQTWTPSPQAVSGTVQAWTSGLQGVSGSVTANATVTGSTGLHVSMPSLIPQGAFSGSCYGVAVTNASVHINLGPSSTYWNFNRVIMSGSRNVTLKAKDCDVVYRWTSTTAGEQVDGNEMTGSWAGAYMARNDERNEQLPLVVNGICVSGSNAGRLLFWGS